MTSPNDPFANQQELFITSDVMHYELDDGPLSEEQVQQIQKLADQQAFTGTTVRKSSLLPNEL